MAGLPLRPFTKQLRERFPHDAGGLRLRRFRTKTHGERFQLIGQLPTHEPVARTLEAKSEFDALEEAAQLLERLVGGGIDPNTRTLPTGRLRGIERQVLHAIAGMGFRQQHERSRANAVKKLMSWHAEAGLPLQAATLLAYIRSTDRHSRQRRDAITAARLVAKTANIPVEIDNKKLGYIEPKSQLVDDIDDAKVLAAYEELLANSCRFEVQWLLGVVLATGCRATSALTFEVESVKEVGDQLIGYDSKRDCMIKTTPTVRGFWRKHHLYHFPEEIEELRMPSDKRATDDQITQANNFVNDAFAHAKRKVSPESAELLKARVLRSACAARCLRAGLSELEVGTILSTSVEQIRARYARFYRASTVENAARLL